MPRKWRTPLAVVGAGAFLIASIFLGSDAIPLPEITNPKNVTEDLLNSHFFSLSVRMTSANFCHTSSPGCIVVSLCLPEDNNIITDVECTGNISELVLNGLLKDLAGRGSAKVESTVPPESLVRCVRSDVSTLGSK